MAARRAIYFHEDDYCQQQLLPRDSAADAGAELRKLGEFADAHAVPGGLGWTDIYIRPKPALRAKLNSIADHAKSPGTGDQDHRNEHGRSASVTRADSPDWPRGDGLAPAGEESVARVEPNSQTILTGSPRPYTWQEVIDGVIVIGFVEHRPTDEPPEMTFDRDYAELRVRMESLRDAEGPGFGVVDFANYRMTGDENGRAVVGLVLRTHQSLEARGGGLRVCNHPAQFNPDLQSLFHMDRFIGIHGTLRAAIDASRA